MYYSLPLGRYTINYLYVDYVSGCDRTATHTAHAQEKPYSVRLRMRIHEQHGPQCAYHLLLELRSVTYSRPYHWLLLYPGLTCSRSVPLSTPVTLPSWLETVNSPLDWRQWESCLADHSNRAYREYLLCGIHEGFRVGYDYSQSLPIRSSENNTLSAREKL